MAVTDYQLQGLLTSAPFLQRVELQLTLTAENVSTEAGGTAQHAQRKALSAAIMNDPASYASKFAEGILAQINQGTTNMVTVSGVANADVDTTDAALSTIISSIYNTYFV